MCTRTIAEATATVGGGVVGGPAGSLAALGAARALGGKPVIGQDIIPRPAKPVFKPPPDIAGAEKRKQAQEFKRTLSGRPGPGRASTIFSRGTGAGPAGFKTKTGQ